MELYTLTRKFIPNRLINEFTSAIWTERYSAAGDMQLVVPAIPDNFKILKPGTFMGLKGTKEIMILETQSVEKGLLTVTGSSLLKFLDERYAWFKNPEYDAENNNTIIGSYLATTSPAQIIAQVVQKMVIDTQTIEQRYGQVDLDRLRDQIPGLKLGPVSTTGTQKPLAFPVGPLYTGMQRLATDEGVGIKLYLASANSLDDTWVLKFATYLGRDLTSGQTGNRLVRLSPKLDSLMDSKEIWSISDYKNVVYVVYEQGVSIHYAEPDLPIPQGFDRRALVVEGEDIYLGTEARKREYRAQLARDAFAKHIYLSAVDGQVSSQLGYQYKKDYKLGDIIELEGLTGVLSKARITEYIYSQDQFGEREYPTLSVIDPLDNGFMPDVEPPGPGEPPDDDTDDDTDDTDTDDTDDWDGDPDIDTDDDPIDPDDPTDIPPDDPYDTPDKPEPIPPEPPIDDDADDTDDHDDEIVIGPLKIDFIFGTTNAHLIVGQGQFGQSNVEVNFDVNNPYNPEAPYPADIGGYLPAENYGTPVHLWGSGFTSRKDPPDIEVWFFTYRGGWGQDSWEKGQIIPLPGNTPKQYWDKHLIVTSDYWGVNSIPLNTPPVEVWLVVDGKTSNRVKIIPLLPT